MKKDILDEMTCKSEKLLLIKREKKFIKEVGKNKLLGLSLE